MLVFNWRGSKQAYKAIGTVCLSAQPHLLVSKNIARITLQRNGYFTAAFSHLFFVYKNVWRLHAEAVAHAAPTVHAVPAPSEHAVVPSACMLYKCPWSAVTCRFTLLHSEAVILLQLQLSFLPSSQAEGNSFCRQLTYCRQTCCTVHAGHR